MKLTVRFPDTVHARLSEVARVERRSLNQTVVGMVEAALGEREPQAEAAIQATGTPVSEAGKRELSSRSSSARVREIAPPLKPFHTDFKKG